VFKYCARSSQRTAIINRLYIWTEVPLLHEIIFYVVVFLVGTSGCEELQQSNRVTTRCKLATVFHFGIIDTLGHTIPALHPLALHSSDGLQGKLNVFVTFLVRDTTSPAHAYGGRVYPTGIIAFLHSARRKLADLILCILLCFYFKTKFNCFHLHNFLLALDSNMFIFTRQHVSPVKRSFSGHSVVQTKT
jgi:hypothetical protein